MRYFDEALVNSHPREHGVWWDQVGAEREWFHQIEDNLAAVSNASAVLPRDAWLELDSITRSIMRADEGQVWMNDLMPLAKPVHIGKLVHLARISSDSNNPVIRSMSGQVPVPMDKVIYDYRGTPVPIFSNGYGREWREWNTLQSENFGALADDQEASVAKIKRDMALYTLNGDVTIAVEGYVGYGIRNHPLSKSINLGSAVGGANINLTSATPEQVENFINGPFGTLLDNNYISGGVNMYVSPEIGRNLDKPYSGVSGLKEGSLRDVLLRNRRVSKIVVSFELTGNEFFWFVPNGEYIRPLIGMALNTVGMPRLTPMANYQFLNWGAMGLQIRADWNGRTAVGYSVVVN